MPRFFYDHFLNALQHRLSPTGIVMYHPKIMSVFPPGGYW